MYGLERIRSALDVEADCIHHAKRALNRRRDRPPLTNIRGNRLDLGIIAARGSWMPGGDANRKLLIPQVANHSAS